MKPIEEIPVKYYSEYFRTGSSVICTPPVLTTDLDVMMLTKSPDRLFTFLEENNWETNFNDYPIEDMGLFRSFKRGVYNLLVTESTDYYSKFEEATKVATKLNLVNKKDRIYLFNYIIDGEFE